MTHPLKPTFSSTGTSHRRFLHNWALFLGILVVGILCGLGISFIQWAPPSPLVSQQDLSVFTPHKIAPANHITRGVTYDLATRRHSYFKLDNRGLLELQDDLPRRSEAIYYFSRKIDAKKTALVIMDPWVNMASTHLNALHRKIAESHIIPLVGKALDRGHPVIVLTNAPGTIAYNTEIHPHLAALAKQKKIDVLYHQDMDDDDFSAHLHAKGIDSLIYGGFASNMCVIGRQMGMIPMAHQGFRLFFIPQASAAIEYPDTWKDQSLHKATAMIISQWIAEIIDYRDFMEANEARNTTADS